MLPGQCNVFIFVVASNKDEWVLCAKTADRRWGSGASNADSSNQLTVLVERNATGHTIQRCAFHRLDLRVRRRVDRTRRRTGYNLAAWRPKRVDVGNEKVRETDPDKWAGRGVNNAWWKVLLDNETRSARCK